MKDISNIKEGQDYLYNNFENIEVEDIDASRNLCYIFFSSNGLYENNFEKFYMSMIEENRFEWKSIAEAVKKRKCVGRIIYIRDVYKRFYIHGINKELNTVSKVLDKLKDLTEGYKVITIGVSSGGYMATVAGVELGAESVFSISGQFDISALMLEGINELEENEKKYLNIISKVKEQTKGNIFYFCPIGCENDRLNFEMVKNIDNVKCFLFSSDKHADTVYPFNFPDIFCSKSEKLERLSDKYNRVLWSKVRFAMKTFTLCGIIEFVGRVIKGKFILKNIKKMWDVK